MFIRLFFYQVLVNFIGSVHIVIYLASIDVLDFSSV